MSPKIVDKEQKREEVLDAAFDVFRRKGYHEATLSEIARAAGMGQGTLYYYFPTKEEIFWCVFARLMTHIEGKLKGKLRETKDPRERLQMLFGLMFRSFPEVGLFDEKEKEEQEKWGTAISGFSLSIMEFWLHAERSGKQVEFYERIGRHKAILTQTMKELLEEAPTKEGEHTDYEVLSHLLVALRDGLSFHLRMGILRKDGSLLKRIQEVLFRQADDLAERFNEIGKKTKKKRKS